MTIYVDPLMQHGWIMHGRKVASCHMFTDQVDLAELHALGAIIGMKREWFQNHDTPHYDLLWKRRVKAVAAGAVEVDRRDAVAIWRARRMLVAHRRAA